MVKVRPSPCAVAPRKSKTVVNLRMSCCVLNQAAWAALATESVTRRTLPTTGDGPVA